jgi:hypothetical protein
MCSNGEAVVRGFDILKAVWPVIRQSRVERLDPKLLVSEEGIDRVLKSDNMHPYIELARVLLQNGDPQPALLTIKAMPLERRYLWRIASALKLAFGDFDSRSVRADCDTLSAEDLKAVVDLLQIRPIQFCAFMTALVGGEQMRKIMLSAVDASDGLSAERNSQLS